MKLHYTVASVAIFAAACIGSPVYAQTTTPVSYVGGGFFTAVTSSCKLVGFSTNQGFTVVYRPGDSSQGAGLDLQFQVGSALLTTTAPNFNGKRPFTTTGITDKAIAYSSNGTSSLAVAISDDGLNVTINGTIPNLYGDPSCVLKVRAAATERP